MIRQVSSAISRRERSLTVNRKTSTLNATLTIHLCTLSEMIRLATDSFTDVEIGMLYVTLLPNTQLAIVIVPSQSYLETILDTATMEMME